MDLTVIIGAAPWQLGCLSFRLSVRLLPLVLLSVLAGGSLDETDR